MNIFLKQLEDAQTVAEFRNVVSDMQKNHINLVRKRDNKRFRIVGSCDACLVNENGKPYAQGLYVEQSEIRDNVQTPYLGYNGGINKCQLRRVSKYFDVEVDK